MKKSTLLFVLVFSFLAMPPVLAEGFPGKGDRFAWSAAIPYYNLANKYLEHGRFDEAVQNYEEAIYRYEYDPDFYINYGVALRKREDYRGAEQAFKKAIELRSNDWQAWSNLANAYLKQNRLKDTIACFQKAMKVQPPPPVQEKQAMLKDIADINKILSMQAPPPAAPAVPAVSKVSPSKRVAAKKAKEPVSVETKQLEQTKQIITSPSASKEDLKKSGWDWIN